MSHACNHPQFAYALEPIGCTDDNDLVVFALRSVKCVRCGSLFRFEGVIARPSTDEPYVDETGQRIALPARAINPQPVSTQ